MGQWRGKLLFMLIVYAAGFGTALYMLTPADIQTANGGNGISTVQDQMAHSGVETPAWAASARAGMNKAVSFAEDKALKLAEVIKTQMAQSKPNTGD